MYGTVSSKLNLLVLAVAKHPISERNHQILSPLYTFHIPKPVDIVFQARLYICCLKLHVYLAAGILFALSEVSIE